MGSPERTVVTEQGRELFALGRDGNLVKEMTCAFLASLPQRDLVCVCDNMCYDSSIVIYYRGDAPTV